MSRQQEASRERRRFHIFNWGKNNAHAPSGVKITDNSPMNPASMSTAELKRDVPIPVGPEVITHRGKMIEVVVQQMQIGERLVPFERARRSPGTRLLITSDTGKILLTKEYRSEIGGYDYRLPGGKVFDSLDEYNQALSAGEDILVKSRVAAQKEAREEVGVQAENITHVYTSKCGATMEWDLHYFAVKVPTEQLGQQQLEAGEAIETGWYSPEQAMELALNGSMSEDRSAAVLMRYVNSTYDDMQLRVAPKPPKIDHEADFMGSKLVKLLETAGLDSLRVRAENLSNLRDIDSIIFVGSSFAGKSTMVDAIRDAIAQDPELASHISIPKRIITRPQRQNDNLIENDFRTAGEFSRMVANGEVGLHWVRKMEGTRTENYGFLPPESGKVPVYSANNAVINNAESVEPTDLLSRSLIIALYAPEEVRERRLQDRSPDLVAQKPVEAAYRLADKAVNMYPSAHIVVKDFGRYEDRSRSDVVSLMKLLVQNIL